MGELAAFVRKHPEAMGLAIIVVVILAYMATRGGAANGGGGDSNVTFTGGGVQAAPLDPNVAAVEEARISAGASNLTTLSQLVLGRQQAAYEADVAEGQTQASLAASLSQTEATRAVGLAAIEGQVSMNATNVAGDIQKTIYNTSAQTAQAAITANTQTSIANANLAAIQDTNATQRDVSRVQAKSQFWHDTFGTVENIGRDLLAFFGV
jgi:hypothetical protein